MSKYDLLKKEGPSHLSVMPKRGHVQKQPSAGSDASKPSPKILFGLSGSIACYKACYLISDLVQSGYDLQAITTQGALQFVGKATLEGLTGHPVLADLYQDGRQMDHIHLVRSTDLFVVCPATACFINKVKTGIADDLLSTCFMANNFKTPTIIAPAMNVEMLNYPATQQALQTLKDWGVKSIVLGEEGLLACGEKGLGRMADVAEIKAHIIKLLGSVT